MFFVLTEIVCNPLNLVPVYAPGEILTAEAVNYLAEELDIDNFECVACTTEQAAIATQRRLLADGDCFTWLPAHAVSPELATARENYAKGRELFQTVLGIQSTLNGMASEVVKFTQWGIDRHLGIAP